MSLRKALGSVVRFMAVCLIAFAMCFALLLVFQGVFNPFQVVVSDSMYPQIQTGDAVVIKDIDPDSIEVGQIIIFKDYEKPDRYIIHRVVAVEDTGNTRFFTTKGDNNEVLDPVKVSAGEVVGGVAVKLPHFGDFLDFITSSGGYVSCIVIPAAVALTLVFAQSLIEQVSGYKRKKKERYSPEPTSKQPHGW